MNSIPDVYMNHFKDKLRTNKKIIFRANVEIGDFLRQKRKNYTAI